MRPSTPDEIREIAGACPKGILLEASGGTLGCVAPTEQPAWMHGQRVLVS